MAREITGGTGRFCAEDLPTKKVLVLYTGGTIGMVQSDGRGLVPAENKFLANIKNRPNMHDVECHGKLSDELKSLNSCLLPHAEGFNHRIVYSINEYNPLLDSSNMGANEWIRIVEDIESNYDCYDGFVVLHGTDTLAYTASVLSFSLENLRKTVIVTGAQLSIFETRTDGIMNFTNSLVIAAMGRIPEVCVVCGLKLLRGNRTAKISCIAFDAFDSPNVPVLGNIQVNVEINYSTIRSTTKDSALKVQKVFNTDIVVLHITPNMSREILSAALKPPTKAVILLTFGSGNVPSNHPDIWEPLECAKESGIILINITQCRHGSVGMAYETSHILYEYGVIPGYDMTVEAAYAKLAYILAQDSSVQEKKEKFLKDLRGEITLPKNLQTSLEIK